MRSALPTRLPMFSFYQALLRILVTPLLKHSCATRRLCCPRMFGGRVYRVGRHLLVVLSVGRHLLVVLSVIATLFAGLGACIAVKNGGWTFLAVVVGLASAAFLLVQILRLEVGPAGFAYCNLSGSRDVRFADIRRAYFEVTRKSNAPQGVAAFWVERHDGVRVRVNLRTFSVEAARSPCTLSRFRGGGLRRCGGRRPSSGRRPAGRASARRRCMPPSGRDAPPQ